MQTKTETQLATARAVHILGGTVKAAKILRVKDERHQTVQSWMRNRVPAEYCPAIERATAERNARVRCEELRPDVDWAALREKPKRTKRQPATQEG